MMRLQQIYIERAVDLLLRPFLCNKDKYHIYTQLQHTQRKENADIDNQI